MENQVYYLRKIHPNTWSGVRLYQFSNEDIGPGIDEQGLPVTGLTEDETITNAKGQKEIIKGSRTEMEKELGYEQGTLKKGTIMKPSDFWLNFAIRIGDGDEKFDMSIPENKLKVAFLRAQPQVADGVKDIRAKSEYVLFTREEEAANSNKEKKIKRKAFSLFEQLTLEDMANILELVGIKASNLTKDVVEDKLSDYMEEYPQKFVAIIEDPTRKNKTFIRKCLDKGVLTLDGGTILFNEVVLGYDIDSAASRLFDKDNGKTLEAIKLQMGITKEKPGKESETKSE